MAGRPTIYEVANRSGVSTATVSRVMHDGSGFSEGTRERVLSAAKDLGWVPSGSASGLASRHAGIVGLLFPDLRASDEADEESPLYVDEVIRGAERASTAAGDAVLIAATRGSTGRELAYSVAGKVDGLVVMARSLAQHDIDAIARSVPVVVLGKSSAAKAMDVVTVDNHAGVRGIVMHLVQVHEYGDIAFVGGPPRSPDSMERFAGFRAAARAAGLPAPTRPDADGDFTEAGGARAAQVVLSRHPRPRAIVFGNDQMAIGALSVLRAAKLRVPADVAVTGFDDISSARHVRPTLTTVRQPMRELGEEAVRILLERVRQPHGPARAAVLPTQLVVRRSCGCRTAASHSRRAVAS